MPIIDQNAITHSLDRNISVLVCDIPLAALRILILAHSTLCIPRAKKAAVRFLLKLIGNPIQKRATVPTSPLQLV